MSRQCRILSNSEVQVVVLLGERVGYRRLCVLGQGEVVRRIGYIAASLFCFCISSMLLHHEPIDAHQPARLCHPIPPYSLYFDRRICGLAQLFRFGDEILYRVLLGSQTAYRPACALAVVKILGVEAIFRIVDSGCASLCRSNIW